VTIRDNGCTALPLPVNGQKPEEIALGDAHDGAVEPVHRQCAVGDPAANGAGRDAESLGDLPDRAKAREGLRRAASLKRPRRNQSRLRKAAGGNQTCITLSVAELAHGGAGQCLLAAAVEPNVWALAHSSTSATR
jgi:hypothetical protein